MISIKDYAADRGITYEAARKQIRRYEDELEGHIITQGKKRFLDEEAVNFLDQKRAANPIIIYEQSKDEELERLRNENRLLLEKIVVLQEQLVERTDKVAALTTEVSEMKLLQAAQQTEDSKQKKGFFAKIFDGWK